MKITYYDGSRPSNWGKCTCGNFAEMKCICEGHDNSDDYFEDDPYYAITQYKVLRCPACHKVTIISYRHTGRVEEEFSHRGEMDIPEPITYDMSIILAPQKKRHYSIPKAIVEVINQAEAVVNSSPRAAFILCRAALEEICGQHKIPSVKQTKAGKSTFISLQERLIILFKEKELPEDLQKIMEGIKDLGNEGVHGSQTDLQERITSEEVETLLELLEYVLEKLYVEKKRAIEANNKLKELHKRVLKNDDDEGNSDETWL